MNAQEPRLVEQLAVLLSHDFTDDDVVFTGLVTGEQAALFAAGIPLAAAVLAQKTHAPNLTLMLAGWIANPDLSQLRDPPQSEFDPSLMTLPCEARAPGYPGLWNVHRGDITVGFSNGAQIDRFGALNTHSVPTATGGSRALVGPILLPEHMTKFGREIVMMPRHDPRTFVERVAFRSSPRMDDQRRDAERYGYRGKGAHLVMTPRCIFDFDDDGAMRVRSIHASSSARDVQASTGFDLGDLSRVPVTPMASADYLHILRTDVDPHRIVLG